MLGLCEHFDHLKLNFLYNKKKLRIQDISLKEWEL